MEPGATVGAELLAPPRQVFGGIGIEGALGPAMSLQIGLVVTVEVGAVRGDAARDRRLEDAGGDGAVAVLDRSYRTYVDRNNRAGSWDNRAVSWDNRAVSWHLAHGWAAFSTATTRKAGNPAAAACTSASGESALRPSKNLPTSHAHAFR